MRVMLLASGDLWAGAEVMVYQLASALVKIPKLDLLVVLLNKGRLAEELQGIGIKVQVLDESKYSFVTLTCAVRKLTVDFSPDIIHSHRYKENLIAWLSTFGRKDISIVATQHGMPEKIIFNIRLIDRLRTALSFRLLSSCFDRTIAVSEEMRQRLVASYGFSSEQVSVVHNGISIPEKLSHQVNDRLVIGTAGRLFPIKDFMLLVHIASLVVAESDIIDFVIAGDGPQYQMLKEKIISYGLQDRFRLLGHQDDMDAFYQSIDVYVNTSVHEGIPMSVLEAMSYGLPVIVSEVGGFPEIIKDGEQGFLIKGRQKEEYSDRILQLLVDPTLRLQMAASARERVVHCFSREAMARMYLEIYSGAIN